MNSTANEYSTPAKYNRPLHGSIIIFTVTPIGSYASINIPYRVELYGHRTVRLVNLLTGSSTSDSTIMYQKAVYSYVTNG